MMAQRKRSSAEFKARVAMAALKGYKTVNEFAGTYGVHPTQIATWKKHLQRELPQIVSTRREKRAQDHDALHAQLYQQIGQLKVELDWLKKNLVLSTEAKRQLITPGHPQSSIRRPCELLGVSRSSVSYERSGENADNLHLMRL